MMCRAADSILAIIDIQPKFMAAVHEAERVVMRSLFVAECASILDIPVVATEQNVARMGPTDARFDHLVKSRWDKMEFGAWGCAGFRDWVRDSERKSVVLVGVEAHICVTQTALAMVAEGFQVFVVVDAVNSRTPEAREIGLARLEEAGVICGHSESVVYEWMESAAHPKFRDVLEVVKRS
jgi:nicotinamidase-related amidase